MNGIECMNVVYALNPIHEPLISFDRVFTTNHDRFKI